MFYKRRKYYSDELSDWELDFLHSIINQIRSGRRLSDKQQTILDRIQGNKSIPPSISRDLSNAEEDAIKSPSRCNDWDRDLLLSMIQQINEKHYLTKKQEDAIKNILSKTGVPNDLKVKIESSLEKYEQNKKKLTDIEEEFLEDVIDKLKNNIDIKDKQKKAYKKLLDNKDIPIDLKKNLEQAFIEFKQKEVALLERRMKENISNVINFDYNENEDNISKISENRILYHRKIGKINIPNDWEIVLRDKLDIIALFLGRKDVTYWIISKIETPVSGKKIKQGFGLVAPREIIKEFREKLEKEKALLDPKKEEIAIDDEVGDFQRVDIKIQDFIEYYRNNLHFLFDVYSEQIDKLKGSIETINPKYEADYYLNESNDLLYLTNIEYEMGEKDGEFHSAMEEFCEKWEIMKDLKYFPKKKCVICWKAIKKINKCSICGRYLCNACIINCHSCNSIICLDCLAPEPADYNNSECLDCGEKMLGSETFAQGVIDKTSDENPPNDGHNY